MNPAWLIRNIAASWLRRASRLDFIRRLLWVYSHKLPRGIRRKEFTIGFRYPEPIGNIQLLLRANDGSDCFILGEVFDHETYRLPLPAPPKTIMDLGANIGLTAIYFGRLFPTAALACVEPVPENLRVLARNLELNAIHATIISAAVDVNDGCVLIERDRMDYGHKIAVARESSSGPLLKVTSLSVPTILQRLGWDRIGLLKIDIEGHERVLFSTDCEWLNLVDNMCIECHEGFTGQDLGMLAERFNFCSPRAMPGIWFMHR